MIFLVNTDYMFTLDYVDIEDIYFFPLLEGVVKENIKLFDQYLKKSYYVVPWGYYLFQLQENINMFWKIHNNTAWSHEILIILTVMKIDLSKS